MQKTILMILICLLMLISGCNSGSNLPFIVEDSLITNEPLTIEASKNLSDNQSTNVIKESKSPQYKIKKDFAYGSDPLQKMDIYYKTETSLLPVIFMVHGGAWKYGDKSNENVYLNKVDHWVKNGFVFISVNYRMLPSADVKTQISDVALALAKAQASASNWNGDPQKFILMGHSAGAHLISLISANPDSAINLGALPWVGSISLDSAALNVVSIMKAPHFKLYDEAFGKDYEYWVQVSPLHQMKSNMAPFLAVCSAKRELCVSHSKEFVDKSNSLGGKAIILPVDLSHGEINKNLGLKNQFTEKIDEFINSLISKKSK